jgi:YD repeat-containing protein
VTAPAHAPHANLHSTTDPLGRVTGATYDDAERQVRVQDPAVNVTTFALDAMGNVVTETVQEQMPDATVRSVAVSHT